MAAALERLSYTDAVTDLPNRRAFDRAIAREWAAAMRTPESMSLLMIDIDRFKDYNDLYGHQAGDHCLRAMARLIAGALHRPADFCGRYGGEEFVILLPATPLQGATVVASRIIERIHTANLPYSQGIDGRVTVSIGVSERHATDLQADALMERADRNLYRAKGNGRHRWDASGTEP
jgi:diguanylate cyclase (GGDEF)-like protein